MPSSSKAWRRFRGRPPKDILIKTASLPAVRRPLMLVGALVAAGIMALSIHVGMLYVGVAFPLAEPPLWARWLNISIVVGAVLVWLKLAHPRIGHCSVLIRTLILFAILMSVRETLRAATMQGVVTTAWAFSAFSLIEPLVRTLLLALSCVIAVRWARSGMSLVIAALVTGAICFAAQMLASEAFRPLAEHFASLALPDLYEFPYPPQVLIPAYLTFAEPVIGATLLVILVWDRLPGSKAARLSLSAALVALVKGVVGSTLLFSFFTQESAALGMLSYSQFLFEFLALGLLTGFAWEAFGRPRSAG